MGHNLEAGAIKEDLMSIYICSSLESLDDGRLEALFPVGTGVNLFKFCPAFYDNAGNEKPNGSLCSRTAYIYYYDLAQVCF